MNSKIRSNSVITHSVDANKITWTVLNAGSITLDMAALNNAIIQRAAIHGMVQRVSDGAALSRDTDTGLSATPQDKLNAMTRLVEHYMSGASEWNLRSAGAPRESGGLLVSVLCEAYPAKTREQLSVWVKGKSAADRAALLLEPRLKVIADRIRAQATANIDTESLMGELDSMEG